MSAKEKAANLRAALKSEGYSSRKVSVRVRPLGISSAIDVTIRSTDVDPKVVRRLAAKLKNVARCETTGEILGGGNCYVDVSWARGVLEEYAADLLAQLKAGESARWNGWRVERSPELGFFHGFAPGSQGADPEVDCFGPEFCARQVAERVLGGERIPDGDAAGADWIVERHVAVVRGSVALGTEPVMAWEPDPGWGAFMSRNDAKLAVIRTMVPDLVKASDEHALYSFDRWASVSRTHRVVRSTASREAAA